MVNLIHSSLGILELSVIWNYDTFEGNLRIHHKFTKKILKRVVGGPIKL